MKQTFIALCLALPLILASCAERREATTNEVQDGAAKINTSAPVRISAENRDAAEPAVAAGHDGTIYVAWVEHRGKDADVLLARMNQEGQLQSAPARVNPIAGEATA